MVNANKSFNPMTEPNDDWSCKFDESPELGKSAINLFSGQTPDNPSKSPGDFSFPSGPSGAEDDDEVTETKIRAFLDEKALDLKKLQTPLYEQFYNSLNAASLPSAVGTDNKENHSNNFNLPPKSPSPSRLPSRRYSAAVDVSYTTSTGSQSKRVSNVGGLGNQNRLDAQSPQLGEWKELILNSQPEPMSPSASFSERQRKWKEELAEELDRKREIMRQAGVVKTPSPKDRPIYRERDLSRFAFPGR